MFVSIDIKNANPNLVKDSIAPDVFTTSPPFDIIDHYKKAKI